MPHKWLRLISWVSLAAYFLANTPAANVLGAPFRVALPPGRHVCQRCGGQPLEAAENLGAWSASATPKALSCKCCARLRRQVPNTTPQGLSDQRDECVSNTCCPAESSNPCCPCCPTDPAGPCCPCPGGCAFCSVAKVPCLGPLTLSPAPASGLGESLAETPLLYFPPPCAELIRPPRS
jgi:hypothetical protein